MNNVIIVETNIPNSSLHLLFITIFEYFRLNPSFPASQKFLPVRMMLVYALVLMNSTITYKQSIAQFLQFYRNFEHLFYSYFFFSI